MFTPERFLDIACEAEVARQIASTAEERSEAHRIAMQAEAAMKLMITLGITEAPQFGPFGSRNLKRGRKVRIKKGTVIQTTHPRYNQENPKIAGRDYVVTIHDSYSGYINTAWHPHEARYAYRDEEVVWAGEGGYWCQVPSGLVEIVE